MSTQKKMQFTYCIVHVGHCVYPKRNKTTTKTAIDNTKGNQQFVNNFSLLKEDTHTKAE